MKYLNALLAWLAINTMGVFVFFAGGMTWGTSTAGGWAFFSMVLSAFGAALAFGLTGSRK